MKKGTLQSFLNKLFSKLLTFQLNLTVAQNFFLSSYLIGKKDKRNFSGDFGNFFQIWSQYVPYTWILNRILTQNSDLDPDPATQRIEVQCGSETLDAAFLPKVKWRKLIILMIPACRFLDMNNAGFKIDVYSYIYLSLSCPFK